MTVKLYENAYCRTFSAQVLACEEKDGNYEVRLDATCFFPEGGGQGSDFGELGGTQVLDVQERNGEIYHTVSSPLSGEVKGEIDWGIRFLRMQSHSGEHLVSGIAHNQFGVNNVGFHMSENGEVVFDFDRVLTREQVRELELEANRAVHENRAITVSFPEHPETLTYRSKLELETGVRLVTIEGYDVCACCAPHVRNTGEIGIVKFLEVTPHRGGVRITAVFGERAFLAICAWYEDICALMKEFSVPSTGILEAVRKCKEERGVQEKMLRQLREENAVLSMETTRCADFTVAIVKDAEGDALRACANAISDTRCAVFSTTGAYLIRGEDVLSLTQALNKAFSGRGGGKPNLTQGRLEFDRETLLKFWKDLEA